ncbi:putative protein arginine N-methyltransferase 6 [Senna tora]|uniref:Uncharacterized protein n=1 Tax=Senna tora TaxID=362788 RepID=A0A834TVN3_9FABA|nr:putative protein arginine N-methyltransferase 6 [Senna tora]
MVPQTTNNVVIKDLSTSGVVKHMEPHTDSSSSEADEGEFFDEASIVSFFDNEEGLLIEQLEKEYEEQERDQKMRLDDGLEGVASLLGMDVHESSMNVNSKGILAMPDEGHMTHESAVDSTSASLGFVRFFLWLPSTGWLSASKFVSLEFGGVAAGPLNSTSNQNAKPCSGAGKSWEHATTKQKKPRWWGVDNEQQEKITFFKLKEREEHA